jgi:hypothetical protein
MRKFEWAVDLPRNDFSRLIAERRLSSTGQALLWAEERKRYPAWATGKRSAVEWLGRSVWSGKVRWVG